MPTNSQEEIQKSPGALTRFWQQHPVAAKILVGVVIYLAVFGKVSQPSEYFYKSELRDTTFIGLWVFGFINLNAVDSLCDGKDCGFSYTGYGYQWAMNRYLVELRLRDAGMSQYSPPY